MNRNLLSGRRIVKFWAGSIGGLLPLVLAFGFAVPARADLTEVKIHSSDASYIDRFGSSVAVDGDRMVVGAPGATVAGGTEGGAVYYFEFHNGAWTEIQKITSESPVVWEYFGCSVALSGNVLVVGGNGYSSNQGRAQVFRWNGSAWVHEQTFLPDGPWATDYFGTQVAASGDTIAVAATADVNLPSNGGAVYVYVYDGSEWVRQQKLVATGYTGIGGLGRSLALEGDRLLAGSSATIGGQSDAGCVIEFDRTGTVWNLVDLLSESVPVANNDFSRSISLQNDLLTVSAPGDSTAGTQTGKVYVYRLVVGVWTVEDEVEAPDAVDYDYFGTSLSLDGDYFAVGSVAHDSTAGADTGKVWLFHNQGGGVWSEIRSFEASDAQPSDQFSSSLAVSSRCLVVGAKEVDDLGTATGAVYVYLPQNLSVRIGAIPIPKGGGPIDFGVASPGASSPERTFVIQNDGSTSVALQAVIPPAGYSVSDPPLAVLAPGTSDTMTLALSTATGGVIAGEVIIEGVDLFTEYYNFLVTGTIDGPEIWVRHEGNELVDGSGTVDLLTSAQGGTSATAVISVGNSGTQSLTISNLTVPSPYQVIDGLPSSIAPGTSDTITVALPTGTSGTYTGDAAIDSNDFDESVFTFSLNGTVSTDTTEPTVVSIEPVAPNPTSANGADFTVTFSEDVTGVDLSDFSLVLSGLPGAALMSISGSGAVYTVHVNTGTGDGTIRLDLVDDDSIRDLSDIPLGGPGLDNGSFHTGTVLTVDRLGPIVYVNRNATGTRDGITFATGFATVQQGIDVASANGFTQVWVEEGTYPGAVVFQSYIEIYGGFGGTETDLSQRDIDGHETILNGAGAYHTVTLEFANRVDGFTITGGNASGAGGTYDTAEGGGIYSSWASGVVADCRIEGNQAQYGAGVYAERSSLQFIRCVFLANAANRNGGALCVDNGTVLADSLSLEDCRFIGNLAGSDGGALYTSLLSTLTVTNSLFAGNLDPGYGAVYLDQTPSATIANCTFDHNGSAILVGTDGSPVTNLALSNSIFSNQSAVAVREGTDYSNITPLNCLFQNNAGGDFNEYGYGTITGGAAINSTVPGASGNLSGDPAYEPGLTGTWTAPPTFNWHLFQATFTDANAQLVPDSLVGKYLRAKPGDPYISRIVSNTETQIVVYGNYSALGTDIGDSYSLVDYHLSDSSAAIDAGSNTAPGVPSADLDGVTRPINGTVDIGVYEMTPSDLPSVVSIRRDAPNPTDAREVDYVVQFSEAVSGFDATDLALVPTGVTGASILSISGDGNYYHVTVLTGTGTGTLGLNLVDDDSIQDGWGNALGGSGAGNGNFTGEVYTLADEPELEVTANGKLVDTTLEPLRFGTVDQGGASLSQTFTVRNTGREPLLVTLSALPAQFSVTEPLAASIPSDGSDSFTLELPSSTVGVFQGDVRIDSNDTDENPFLMNVIGVVAQPPTLPSAVDLLTTPTNLIVYGPEPSAEIGVGAALRTGDLNGDGVEDLVIGTEDGNGPAGSRTACGEAYIYFGAAGQAGTLDTAGIVGRAPDVIIYGADSYDRLTHGNAIGVADLNGDGTADLVLGAPHAAGPGNLRGGCGEAYVFYGSPTWPQVIDLQNGGQDTIIYGPSGSYVFDLTDTGIVRFGDLNGDGIQDLVIGSPNILGTANGVLYVFYGSTTPWAPVRDLDSNEYDVRILGPTTGTYSGTLGTMEYMGRDGDVELAEVNGDSYDDLIIGCPYKDGLYKTRPDSGEVYIIYGGPSLPATINIASNQQNVTIVGTSFNTISINGALRTGDFNGDGISDILIGCPNADGPLGARTNAGEAYLIFGSPSLPSRIDLYYRDADAIFTGANGDYAAYHMDSLTSMNAMAAGDINGDGYDDVILGTSAFWGPDNTRNGAGAVYVVFGSPNLSGEYDFKYGDYDAVVYGAVANDAITYSGSLTAFDLDGDGTEDIEIGAPFSNDPVLPRGHNGKVYAIRGSASLPTVLDLSSFAPMTTVMGADTYDAIHLLDTYGSPSRRFDFNADGYLDVVFGSYVASGPNNSRSLAGEVYSVYGKGPSPTATVIHYTRPGAAPRQDFGTARCEIAFHSGDSLSCTTTTLTRNKSGVTLAPGSGVADVQWEIQSDRTNFSADLTFHYIESEIHGLTESDLRIFQADAPGGPYTELPTVIDAAHNTATVSVSSFSHFFLATIGPEADVFEGTTPVFSNGTAVDFGAVDLGSPAPQKILILKNDGRATLNISGLAASAGFSVVEGLPATLAPGAQDTFTIAMDTSGGGTVQGTVTITSDDGDEGSYVINLTGFINAPEIAVSENSATIGNGGGPVDFGAALVGSTPPEKTFTVQNTGQMTLTLANLSIPSGYVVTEGLSSSLAPGASDTFTIQLPTASTGIYSGTVGIDTNDPNNNPFDFSITGLITAPEIEVFDGATPLVDGSATVDLGVVGIGTTPPSRTFTVSNTGDGDLLLSSLSVPAGYTVVEGLDAVVSPGGSDTFTIQLSTAAVGTFSGTLSFSTNDSNENPFDFQVTGQVASPKVSVSWNEAPLPPGSGLADLGSVVQGDAVSTTFVLANTGDWDLGLSNLAVPSQCTVLDPIVATLAPSTTDSLVLSFDTSVSGLVQGSVSFDTTDPDVSSFSFTVRLTVVPRDQDQDGVIDDVENAAPNSGDANNDGTPDCEQAYVVSLPNATDSRYVTLVAPSDDWFRNVQAVPNPSPADTPTAPSFPVGFFAFDLHVGAAGVATSVDFLLPNGVSANTYYKYGAEPANTADHWWEFSYNGLTGGENIPAGVRVHFIDGGRGDNDLLANGVIPDPGAPALQANQVKDWSLFGK